VLKLESNTVPAALQNGEKVMRWDEVCSPVECVNMRLEESLSHFIYAVSKYSYIYILAIIYRLF